MELSHWSLCMNSRDSAYSHHWPKRSEQKQQGRRASEGFSMASWCLPHETWPIVELYWVYTRGQETVWCKCQEVGVYMRFWRPCGLGHSGCRNISALMLWSESYPSQGQYIGYVSHCYDKLSHGSNFREEGFILAYSLKGYSPSRWGRSSKHTRQLLTLLL